MDQRELARSLAQMERVIQGRAYDSCSYHNLIERVLVLARRCQERQPGPSDSPGMQLVGRPWLLLTKH